MLICQNEIEDSFRWITEKGKDVGIHLIVSTQKPSPRLVDILNSKNDLTRISFMATPTDLNTTIGMKVKEKPSIKGEMLFRPYGTDEIKMIVGPYVSEQEIIKLVGACASQQEIKELDRIKTKDGRVGTVLSIWFDTSGLEVEFDDTSPETETIDIEDIEEILNKK